MERTVQANFIMASLASKTALTAAESNLERTVESANDRIPSKKLQTRDMDKTRD
jgi:hypothetical protein